MQHKILLLVSTIVSGKSLVYQVTGTLISGITLVIVLLLALGANLSKGINHDEVLKSSKEKRKINANI